MMDIPCNEPTFMFGDKQSVLTNTADSTSQLKKKSNSIAYHFVQEGCAKDEWCTTYVNTDENCADLMTKVLSSGSKCNKFIRMLRGCEYVVAEVFTVFLEGIDAEVSVLPQRNGVNVFMSFLECTE
ncbi:hypothetical protein ACHAWF_008918 [Thalassiosira exigua]